MNIVSITEEHKKFVDIYADKQTIGGLSNLDKKDLEKFSRNDYQKTGIFGELAWYIHRYGSYDKLKALLDYKFENLRPKNIGDNGFDDSITYKGKTRLIDIKSSFIENENKINYLNLVIPDRELHRNMIYICAFTLGKDRRNVDKVILAGWCYSEDIKDRWNYDNKKWAVPFKKLRPMKELEQFINAGTSS
jgi:hypothetical protein